MQVYQPSKVVVVRALHQLVLPKQNTYFCEEITDAEWFTKKIDALLFENAMSDYIVSVARHH